MITIVLRDIGFEGRHGATAIERKSLRKFEADMEVEVDGDSGQLTDRLADTVDYSALAETIVSIGAGEPHRLAREPGDARARAGRSRRVRGLLRHRAARRARRPGAERHLIDRHIEVEQAVAHAVPVMKVDRCRFASRAVRVPTESSVFSPIFLRAAKPLIPPRFGMDDA